MELPIYQFYHTYLCISKTMNSKQFSHFYFLNKDISRSLNMDLPVIKLDTHVNTIPLGGIFSQIFSLGLSY